MENLKDEFDQLGLHSIPSPEPSVQKEDILSKKKNSLKEKGLLINSSLNNDDSILSHSQNGDTEIPEDLFFVKPTNTKNKSFQKSKKKGKTLSGVKWLEEEQTQFGLPPQVQNWMSNQESTLERLNESVMLNNPIYESINVSVVDEVPEEHEVTKNTTLQFSEITPKNSTEKFTSNIRLKKLLQEDSNQTFKSSKKEIKVKSSQESSASISRNESSETEEEKTNSLKNLEDNSITKPKPGLDSRLLSFQNSKFINQISSGETHGVQEQKEKEESKSNDNKTEELTPFFERRRNIFKAKELIPIVETPKLLKQKSSQSSPKHFFSEEKSKVPLDRMIKVSKAEPGLKRNLTLQEFPEQGKLKKKQSTLHLEEEEMPMYSNYVQPNKNKLRHNRKFHSVINPLNLARNREKFMNKININEHQKSPNQHSSRNRLDLENNPNNLKKYADLLPTLMTLNSERKRPLSPKSQLKLNRYLSMQYKNKRQFKLCCFCWGMRNIQNVYSLILINDIFLSANLLVLCYIITFSLLYTFPSIVFFFLSSGVYIH